MHHVDCECHFCSNACLRCACVKERCLLPCAGWQDAGWSISASASGVSMPSAIASPLQNPSSATEIHPAQLQPISRHSSQLKWVLFLAQGFQTCNKRLLGTASTIRIVHKDCHQTYQHLRCQVAETRAQDIAVLLLTCQLAMLRHQGPCLLEWLC